MRVMDNAASAIDRLSRARLSHQPIMLRSERRRTSNDAQQRR
jgi:hypothetical protein